MRTRANPSLILPELLITHTKSGTPNASRNIRMFDLGQKSPSSIEKGSKTGESRNL